MGRYDADDEPIESGSLSPAQRSRVRRLSRPADQQPGDEAGELNVIPYLDIIMNVMIFTLATVAVTFVTSLDVEPQAVGGSGVREASKKTLNLSAIVTGQGVSLKTSGGNISTGCRAPGPGITVPMIDGGYDWRELKECARRLKDAVPEFAAEDQVTMTANPDVPYRVIVDAMDALREDDKGLLFDKVFFSVAR
jgi:biopolymer transport protein TolR